MTPEVSEVTSVQLDCNDVSFRAAGSKHIFPGFTKIDKEEKPEKSLPDFSLGDKVEVIDFMPEQKFTSPPPRFNDASLVKFLEESGVGRPSTYAPTINTIITRYYVTRTGRQIVPTILGKLVNSIMVKNFSDLVSTDFTAEMEEKLDLIEESKADWVKMLGEFYSPFKQTLNIAENNIEEMKGILDEETDMVCEKCNAMMKKKLGRYGYFLACSGFPNCRNAKPLPLGKCSDCDGDIVKRSSKTGRGGTFYSCTNYPDCEFVTRETPVEHPCPKCAKILFASKIKGKGYEVACKNKSCDYRVELLDEENSGVG
jgi:DNA topoisomerase-1